jgi:HME family heavy-metal exporter
MSQLKVTFNDIVKALETYGANTGGGFVNQGTQEFLIRNLARTQSLEDLRTMHQAGPIDDDVLKTTRDLFNQSWKAIITLEMAKKRGQG